MTARKNTRTSKPASAPAPAPAFSAQDVSAIATAVAQALAPAITDALVSAIAAPTQGDAVDVTLLNAQNEQQRTRNARKRQRQNAPAPAPTPAVQDADDVKPHTDFTRPANAKGVIIGLVAVKGKSRRPVDKRANQTRQCALKSCRKHRSGKSLYCPAHKADARTRYVKACESGDWSEFNAMGREMHKS